MLVKLSVTFQAYLMCFLNNINLQLSLKRAKKEINDDNINFFLVDEETTSSIRSKIHFSWCNFFFFFKKLKF